MLKWNNLFFFNKKAVPAAKLESKTTNEAIYKKIYIKLTEAKVSATK